MALMLTMDLKLCAMSIATYLGDLLIPRDIAAESSAEHSVKWLPAEKRTRLSEVLKWRVILDLKSS
jgi:hypothetical protein